MSERPNILLVVVDCGRSDLWLGERGTTLTPNLDRVRREGVTFPATIVEQSATSPNFATLLTGLYSPRHGVRMILGQTLRPEVRLLTEDLVALGYRTYAEMTGPLIAEIGLDRGFDRYEYRAPSDYLHTAWGDRFVSRLQQGAYRSPWFILLHLWELHVPRQIVPAKPGQTGSEDAYRAAVASLDAQLGRVFDAAGGDAVLVVTGDHGEKTKSETYRPGTAVDYIRRYLGIDRARGASLFQVSSLVGPSTLHELFAEVVAPALREAGRQGRQPSPSFALGRRIGDAVRLLRLLPRITPLDLLVLKEPHRLTDWLHEKGLLDAKRSRLKVSRFLRHVRPDTLDEMFARLMISTFKKSYEEGHSLHVYDYLVRVPLVVRWKGRLPGGLRIPRMVRQPDILPTILDLLGSQQAGPEDLDGRSFEPLLEGRPWEPRPAFLSTGSYLSQLEIEGVRTEDWKYSYGPNNKELPEELYDLRRDPGETANLAAARPEVCRSLRSVAEILSRPKEGPPASDLSDRGRWEDRERRLKALGYLD
jgi:arylsulfatase A-like enzyme